MPPPCAAARKRGCQRGSDLRNPQSEADSQRLLHELEVQNEELRRTQGELETALERYTDFYDFTPAGYLTLKPDSTIRQANLTAASLLGIERTRLLKRRFVMFVAAAARPAFTALLARAFASKAPEAGELRLAIKGKPPVTVQLQACVSREGQECRVVLTDITGRKQAEEALQQSQTELRTIYENAPTMMCVLNASRQVLYANRAFAEFVGRPMEEIRLEGVGDAIGCFRALDDPRGCGHGPHCVTCPVRLAMVDALATGRSHRAVEFRTTALCHGQPRDLVFLASVVPIQMTGQSNLLLCLEDITEREQAQEAQRQFSGELLRVQDEERRCVARELHDTIAQSLAVLSLNLGLLQSRKTALNPRSKKLLADSQALADRCAQEVRTSSYLLHPPILDELGLAGAMRDHADGFARRSGLRVDLELPPDLVRLPRETELALFRVFQEVLANIQRHSGSKTASIRVAQTADEIRLEVRDTGRGMVTRSAPGTVSGCAPLGVGILGMKERMRQLGGRLEIQSDGHGTSGIATVPRNQETRPA